MLHEPGTNITSGIKASIDTLATVAAAQFTVGSDGSGAACSKIARTIARVVRPLLGDRHKRYLDHSSLKQLVKASHKRVTRLCGELNRTGAGLPLHAARRQHQPDACQQPANAEELYQKLGRPAMLLLLSELFRGQAKDTLIPKFTCCPVCGHQSGRNEQNAPIRWWNERHRSHTDITLLTVAGPKIGRLEPRKCRECKALIQYHTAVLADKRVVWLNVPPEDMGLMRINDTLYVELGLMQQWFMGMHRLNASYQGLSEVYNANWACSPCPPALDPSGADLQHACQLWFLSHLNWHEELWPWWETQQGILQQQQQGAGAAAGEAVLHPLSPNAHPLQAIVAQKPPQKSVLFNIATKRHNHALVHGDAAAPEQAGGAAGAQQGNNQRIAAARAENAGALQAGNQQAAVHAAEKQQQSNQKWFVDGLMRVAVAWLLAKNGGMSDPSHSCEKPCCSKQQRAPEVIIVDGTDNPDLRIHCCAKAGCPLPPVRRSGNPLSERRYCRQHMHLHDAQPDAEQQAAANAEAEAAVAGVQEAAAGDEDNGRKLVALKGLLAMFLPCGQVMGLCPQYEKEGPDTMLQMLQRQWLSADDMPSIVVYNDADDTIKHLQALSAEHEHQRFRNRLAMDVMRFQASWTGALSRLKAATMDQQQGKEGAEEDVAAAEAEIEVLLQVSPFTKDGLRDTHSVSHLGDMADDPVEDDPDRPQETTSWDAVCRLIHRLHQGTSAQQACWPNALRLTKPEVKLLFRRPEQDEGQGQDAQTEVPEGYVYLQVVPPDGELPVWRREQPPSMDDMAHWRVTVFKLVTSTSVAEKGWSRALTKGLRTAYLMTHDHAIIHVILTLTCERAYNTACEKQLAAARQQQQQQQGQAGQQQQQQGQDEQQGQEVEADASANAAAGGVVVAPRTGSVRGAQRPVLSPDTAEGSGQAVRRGRLGAPLASPGEAGPSNQQPGQQGQQERVEQGGRDDAGQDARGGAVKDNPQQQQQQQQQQQAKVKCKRMCTVPAMIHPEHANISQMVVIPETWPRQTITPRHVTPHQGHPGDDPESSGNEDPDESDEDSESSSDNESESSREDGGSDEEPGGGAGGGVDDDEGEHGDGDGDEDGHGMGDAANASHLMTPDRPAGQGPGRGGSSSSRGGAGRGARGRQRKQPSEVGSRAAGVALTGVSHRARGSKKAPDMQLLADRQNLSMNTSKFLYRALRAQHEASPPAATKATGAQRNSLGPPHPVTPAADKTRAHARSSTGAADLQHVMQQASKLPHCQTAQVACAQLTAVSTLQQLEQASEQTLQAHLQAKAHGANKTLQYQHQRTAKGRVTISQQPAVIIPAAVGPPARAMTAHQPAAGQDTPTTPQQQAATRQQSMLSDITKLHYNRAGGSRTAQPFSTYRKGSVPSVRGHVSADVSPMLLTAGHTTPQTKAGKKRRRRKSGIDRDVLCDSDSDLELTQPDSPSQPQLSLLPQPVDMSASVARQASPAHLQSKVHDANKTQLHQPQLQATPHGTISQQQADVSTAAIARPATTMAVHQTAAGKDRPTTRPEVERRQDSAKQQAPASGSVILQSTGYHLRSAATASCRATQPAAAVAATQSAGRPVSRKRPASPCEIVQGPTRSDNSNQHVTSTPHRGRAGVRSIPCFSVALPKPAGKQTPPATFRTPISNSTFERSMPDLPDINALESRLQPSMVTDMTRPQQRPAGVSSTAQHASTYSGADPPSAATGPSSAGVSTVLLTASNKEPGAKALEQFRQWKSGLTYDLLCDSDSDSDSDMEAEQAGPPMQQQLSLLPQPVGTPASGVQQTSSAHLQAKANGADKMLQHQQERTAMPGDVVCQQQAADIAAAVITRPAGAMPARQAAADKHAPITPQQQASAERRQDSAEQQQASASSSIMLQSAGYHLPSAPTVSGGANQSAAAAVTQAPGRLVSRKRPASDGGAFQGPKRSDRSIQQVASTPCRAIEGRAGDLSIPCTNVTPPTPSADEHSALTTLRTPTIKNMVVAGTPDVPNTNGLESRLQASVLSNATRLRRPPAEGGSTAQPFSTSAAIGPSSASASTVLLTAGSREPEAKAGEQFRQWESGLTLDLLYDSDSDMEAEQPGPPSQSQPRLSVLPQQADTCWTQQAGQGEVQGDECSQAQLADVSTMPAVKKQCTVQLQAVFSMRMSGPEGTT